jgi:outer membrane lipopolysaccharide assembly protein LptE/RlpB
VTTAFRLTSFVMAAALLFLLAGCGYHTAGKAVRLPENIHTLYVPAFTNSTQGFRVGQALTSAVVQELRSRTNFQVLVADTGSADATLRGTVTSASTAPLTYDSRTGKVSSSLLQIGMNVALVDRTGKVLWQNPNYLYREQYELSQDAASFFEEESPALQRIANGFARTLVSNIVEAY